MNENFYKEINEDKINGWEVRSGIWKDPGWEYQWCAWGNPYPLNKGSHSQEIGFVYNNYGRSRKEAIDSFILNSISQYDKIKFIEIPVLVDGEGFVGVEIPKEEYTNMSSYDIQKYCEEAIKPETMQFPNPFESEKEWREWKNHVDNI